MDYGYIDMLECSLLKEIDPEAGLTLLIARWLIHNMELSERKSIVFADIKWERFKEFMSYHELLPFAYPFLKTNSHILLDKEIELLKQSYRLFFINNCYFWQEFMHIMDIFRDKKIEFIPLKGISFLIDNIYSDKTYLRPMCDIDLLIKDEALDCR